MLLSVEGAPFAFRCVPAVQYGIAAGIGGDRGRLLLDLLVPQGVAGSRPVALYLPSNGWVASDRTTQPWVSPLLAAHGFLAVSATHRTGDVAAFPGQLHDAKAAVRWLRANAATYGADPNRIGVWGDSAGGHLAALLGTTAEVATLEGDGGNPGLSTAVQAVIARCTPFDFQQLIAGKVDPTRLQKLFPGPAPERDYWIEQASPRTHVHRGIPPFLVVHGTHDETATYGPAQEFAAALRENGNDVTLHTINGGHHNLRTDGDLPWSDEPWEALGYQALDFFSSHLRP